MPDSILDVDSVGVFSRLGLEEILISLAISNQDFPGVNRPCHIGEIYGQRMTLMDPMAPMMTPNMSGHIQARTMSFYPKLQRETRLVYPRKHQHPPIGQITAVLRDLQPPSAFPCGIPDYLISRAPSHPLSSSAIILGTSLVSMKALIRSTTFLKYGRVYLTDSHAKGKFAMFCLLGPS
jgi:hypothetical protein